MRISGKILYVELDFNKIILLLVTKLIGTVYRLIDIIRLLPIRLYRVIRHLLTGVKAMRPRRLHWWESELNKNVLVAIWLWFTELFIYIIECFGVSEWYETFMDFAKYNTRPLTDWEIKMAKEVFGESINYKRVRVDEHAFCGPKQYKFCYVSFYTINSWGSMRNSLLLHELTHVWQYEQLGGIYIPRALMAQHSQMGYNYGGISALRSCLRKGKDFFAFNFEQQGEIVADYYLIKDGYRPNWGRAQREDLPIYETFIEQLKKGV